MNKNKILSGGGKHLTEGGKWGWRGREVGGEGEGSGVKGGGKLGLGTPLSIPSVFVFTCLTQIRLQYGAVTTGSTLFRMKASKIQQQIAMMWK